MPKASKASKNMNYYDYDARKTTPIVPEYQNPEDIVPVKPKKKKPVDKLAGLLEGLSM
jgi:hypothetical protein